MHIASDPSGTPLTTRAYQQNFKKFYFVNMEIRTPEDKTATPKDAPFDHSGILTIKLLIFKQK